MPDFVKIAQGLSSLTGKFLPKKIELFAILSYLSPHFYTHNVEIFAQEN